ncbi:MAG: hypothetical protein ACT4PM_03750 [Gemmatimonadales bacterium]
MFVRSGILVFALGLVTAPAVAHEKGAIRLDKKEVATGSNLGIRGDRMPKNATVTLQLRGTLETFALGEAKADSGGRFSINIGLPPEARTGSYMVTVVAGDGDKIAEAPLVIVAAAVAPGHDMAAHGAPNVADSATESAHATAQLMPLETSTSGAQWAVIGALIGASLVGGALLLRKRG